jgi:uncharacterized damage-inducible protein DinB
MSHTLQQSLIEIFERDLAKLGEEINLYADEKDIWKVNEGINNSAGNLCLHLTGNLLHFIGAVLGKSEFIRERDKEFSLNNIPRAELLKSIEQTAAVVKSTLSKLTSEDFNNDFPVDKHGQKVTTCFMLLHLTTHFNYHLGQINYHRRIKNI